MQSEQAELLLKWIRRDREVAADHVAFWSAASQYDMHAILLLTLACTVQPYSVVDPSQSTSRVIRLPLDRGL